MLLLIVLLIIYNMPDIPFKRSIVDCRKAILAAVKDMTMSEGQADELLMRVTNIAKNRAQKEQINLTDALRKIPGELSLKIQTEGLINKRNQLLSVQAFRKQVRFAQRSDFETMGQGLTAALEGDIKHRYSTDTKFRALHRQYFGQLTDELISNDLWGIFKHGELDHEITIEMGELTREGGKPGITGSVQAAKLASILHDLQNEMVTRLNSAGAYVERLPGYVMRQTHDMTAIRAAGSDLDSSFKAWYEFTLPKIDVEKTMEGYEPESFMRKVHEGLYTNIHGAPLDESEVTSFSIHGSMARRASRSRVLHFKDAEGAWQYNQVFGSKRLKDAVLIDLLQKSRSIAMMEDWGPNPEKTFNNVRQSLLDQARTLPDAARHVDSLNAEAVEGAFRQVAGYNDIPKSPTLHRYMAGVRTVAMMAHMGKVVLSSFSDKAFLQLEMAYNGMSHLDVIGRQFFGMLPRTEAEYSQLRRMGAMLDSLIGNTLQRYTLGEKGSGMLSSMGQRFFDLNFMNWWNNVNKATASEMLAHNLGENAHLTFKELSEDLRNVLKIYNFNDYSWDALRHTAHETEWGKIIMPDAFQEKSADRDLVKILMGRNIAATPVNKQRLRNEIELMLRSYIFDRTDFAVPTPGAFEQRLSNFNTQAGTKAGETARMMMMFKSFPITLTTKIINREIYGRNAATLKQWLMNDHKGKFNITLLAAMTFVAGYLSESVRTLLKGRQPASLIKQDNSINWDLVNRSMLRSGGLGILGDLLLTEYDREYNSMSASIVGPVLGQADPLFAMMTKARHGKNISRDMEKLIVNNTPYMNLFYIRPVVDYLVLWNLENMLDPGSKLRMENMAAHKGEPFIIKP